MRLLQEGEAVALVAEATGLSRSQVYNLRYALDRQPRGSQPAVAPAAALPDAPDRPRVAPVARVDLPPPPGPPVAVRLDDAERARIARTYGAVRVPEVKTVAPPGLCGEVVYRRGAWLIGGQ